MDPKLFFNSDLQLPNAKQKGPPGEHNRQMHLWAGNLKQTNDQEKEMATPLLYFCLGNPMGTGARQATVHGVAKSQTRLSD